MQDEELQKLRKADVITPYKSKVSVHGLNRTPRLDHTFIADKCEAFSTKVPTPCKGCHLPAHRKNCRHTDLETPEQRQSNMEISLFGRILSSKDRERYFGGKLVQDNRIKVLNFRNRKLTIKTKGDRESGWPNLNLLKDPSCFDDWMIRCKTI